MAPANSKSAARWLSGASLAVIMLGIGSEAHAQASVIDEVVVTGTRRTDRTVADSAVPIDVVSAETFRTTPATDMNNILKNVIPSFNVQRLGIADGSTYVRPPTMRGLPPDQILVLVNGKRFHRAALVQLAGTQVGPMAQGAQGVDLALIPTAAIGRLEVLRDGASAQYGSDAIAGVMNFILNRNDSGVRMTARYGQFLEGDGKDYQLTANIGLPLGSTGFFNLSGEYIKSDETNRGIQSPVALAIFKVRPDLKGVIPNPDRVSGNPTEESYKLFFNAGIDLDNGGEVYAFGDYVESTKTSTFNWRVPVGAPNPDFIPGTNCGTTGSPATCSQAAYTNSAFRTASFGMAGVFNPIYLDKTGAFDSKGNPIWDANGRTFSFLSMFPGGFAPRFGADITDASIGGGYKGKHSSGVTYDFFAGYGMNRIEYMLKDTVNGSLGPASPTSFKIGTLEQRELNLNADFTYEWKLASLDQPILLSAGAEYRRERYLIGLGDYGSYAVGQYGAQVLNNGRTVTQAPGASGFGGYSPAVVTDRSQSSTAFYLGAEGDLTERFQFGAMLRYENFDTFGSTATGKITSRYEFTDNFAIRGTVSTGFRAATPGQQGTYALSTNFSDPANPLVPVITGTYPIDSGNAKYFGATDLKPEKALNFSGGFVWQPLPRTTITLDYYNIKVKDRITLSPTFAVSATTITGNVGAIGGCAATNDKQALACLGDPNAPFLFGVNYFANLFATRTEGVDLVASNSYTSDFGQWNTTLAANWNQTKVTKRNKYDYNGAAAISIEETNPKFKFNITENWQIGKFSTTARVSWYGKWKQVPLSGRTPINSSTTVPTNPGALIYNPILEYPAEYTVDLDVTYRLTDNIQISVGAENLLDRYPEKSRENVFPATGTGQFGSYYPGGTTIGTNGAFWYTKLTAEF